MPVVTVDEPGGVGIREWIVRYIRIPVPGLRCCRIDGGEASRIGGNPATQRGGVLTEVGMIEVCLGVALVVGEFVRGSCAAGNLFAEGEIVERVVDGLVELSDKVC